MRILSISSMKTISTWIEIKNIFTQNSPYSSRLFANRDLHKLELYFEYFSKSRSLDKASVLLYPC